MNLTDFIIVIPNLIDDKLCKTIINEFSEDEYQDAIIESDSVEKNIRNCQTISLSTNETINVNKSSRDLIDAELFKVMNSAILQYSKIHKELNISQDTGYELLRYKKNNFYKEHIDSFTSRPRAVTCSLVLNNKFKGGEFSFFNNKISYKLNSGDAILFPSNFMYPHSVQPIKSGIRYAIVTWFL